MKNRFKNLDIRAWLVGGAIFGAFALGMIGVALDSVPITAVCAPIGSVLGATLGAWIWVEATEDDHS